MKWEEIGYDEKRKGRRKDIINKDRNEKWKERLRKIKMIKDEYEWK